MPDATLSKLLHLVRDGDSTEIRRSALKVLGSVGSKDARLVKILLETLGDPEIDLRIAAIEALGQLQIEEALPRLEPLVRQGGAELEAAVHAAALLGTRGAKLMGKIMHEVSPSIKSRMAAVLAKATTGNALVVTAQGLLDDDPKVIEATARSLAMEVPTYSSPQRQALAKFLTEALGIKRIATKSEAAMLRLLSALHEAKGEELFWARILPPYPADVRAAALHALGGDAEPGSPKRLQALLTCAADREFAIVAAALMILKKVPVTAKNAKPWLGLFDAPDVATRRFAVEKLQGIAGADIARAMTAQLRHPDKSLRDLTLAALRSHAAGRAAILQELLAAADVETAWNLARAVAPSGQELTSAQRGKLFGLAVEFIDTADRRSAPLLFLLREIDAAWLRDQLEARGQEFRKKKKYAEALTYYRLLAQDSACSEETRFELAATGLKLSPQNLAPETRANDPALHQFTRLLQNPSFDLIGHVGKAKWLATEDLFYLGFHFAEQTHRAHEFGKQLLEMVVKRSAKSELGKQAKRKLKSEGLA